MTAVNSLATEPPEAGGWVELDGGLLWIRLPIPGQLRHINVWLVPGKRGWVLVDTGMQTPEIRQAWEALSRRLPLAGGLSAIVVTHHHPDHYGMAQWLSQRFDAEVWMNPRAAAMAAALLQDGVLLDPPTEERYSDSLGVEFDPETRRIFSGVAYRRIVSGLVPTRPLGQGNRLPAADEDWWVSEHDGHAPGHLCLHQRAAGLLISGDQVLPRISSNVGLYPGSEDADPLGDYLRSLDALATLPADTLVLPAHGHPFRHLHGRLDALRLEHRERLGKIEEFCASPRSTGEVTARLFRLERLDALNRVLALMETLAHLRRLELEGRIGRSDRGTRLRWARSLAELSRKP